MKDVSDYIKTVSKPDFISLAKKNPQAAAKKLGLSINSNVNIKVTKNTAKVMHLVLPPKPVDEINDSELQNMAGGFGFINIDLVHQAAISRLAQYPMLSNNTKND